MKLSQRQSQVGRATFAELSDPDGGEVISKWEWAAVTAESDGTCDDEEAFGSAITGASSASYSPKTAENGMCLQARATYKDNQGTTDEMAHVTSDGAVQMSNPANSAPKFPDQNPSTVADESDETVREVAENTKSGVNIGGPVTAEDAGELLMYVLGGPDMALFGIDFRTGQVKTKAALDYEALPDDAKYYMVTVMAADPSGASDSIMVTINVTDVNDGATITPSTAFTYGENGMDPVETFTASDPEGDAIAWSLDGRDKGDFKITPIGDGSSAELRFKKSPNYESPDSSATGTLAERNIYQVTVKATGGSEDITVTVENEDEDGKVSLNKPQPQATRQFEATLSDPDGGVSDERWQWARSEDGETWTDIEGATSPTRNPVTADLGSYLRATVTYADIFGAGKSEFAVSENRVEARTLANAAPSFADQDEETAVGVQVNRSMDEETAEGMSVGKLVSATDADGDDLLYTLEDGGTDTDNDGIVDSHEDDDSDNTTPEATDGDSTKFTIDGRTGQLKAKVKLSYEAAAGAANNCVVKNDCKLTVKATDPSGAPKSVQVSVSVKDVNEAPEFPSGAPTTLTVSELATDNKQLQAGDPLADLGGTAYVATDEDTTYDTAFEYILEGPDGGTKKLLSITDSGVLSVHLRRPPAGLREARVRTRG